MHVKVKVFPESKEEVVKEVEHDQFEVYIREAAKGGQANKRVQEIFAKRFPGARIRLVLGHMKHHKVFEIIK